jgi:hypothetical protein
MASLPENEGPTGPLKRNGKKRADIEFSDAETMSEEMYDGVITLKSELSESPRRPPSPPHFPFPLIPTHHQIPTPKI